MNVREVSPLDTTWEQDHARYRVYFWDVAAMASDEYEVLGEVDVEEVLAWASRYAAERGWSYTVYALALDNGRPGLIRLAGVLGDPFA
ncbi:hypothetical protein [Streptomyces hoynatensis]|uniref:Uncharacterized protein n=1 Tax=Streptomyces hoynatensis TaxID=1141874 RepID=A0A3A9ZET9_9ACTN|nr:hypothetical protein [Streptomyces hoynatensis]RKN46709.1 hypothetical protein D7294_00300 [Streptomyces hoynatensis]